MSIETIQDPTPKEIAAAAKLKREMNQLIESYCNKIYAIAHAHKIPVVLMHQDHIYVQDDDVGTNRVMMENLDKTLSN